MKIVAFFNLKKGVDREKYKKWAREVDMETTKKVPSVKSFVICEVKEVEKWAEEGNREKSGGEFMEIAEADSMEVWKNLANVDFMKKVVEEWHGYCDKDSVQIFYANEV